ncbi:hypothetical protein QQ020_14265 [Fulvivirgaceae bacterium BMA12]|uniref:Uncharacterized protein n=1 Tax=Agaribacillus aureus TaxID=3051825 RepID=A0ABT8L656_9BACT|nr:hypothetical protein [Fulvivirgaceae bacterium BMA12]
MFATMLRLLKAYLTLSTEKLKKWCSILPLILMLVNIFNPVITLMTFHWQFDKYLVECGHLRHHDEYCQASCILEEMMPEQAEAIPEKAISITYFFSDLFLQNRQWIPTFLLSEILMANLFSNYLLLYSPPVLEMHSPPPQLS